MKIGILTYHKANNYGALLQAVATRVYLQSVGHEVYYVDYWPAYHKDKYSLFNLSRFKSLNIIHKLLYLFSSLANYWGQKKRIKVFSRFIIDYIEPYCKPYPSNEQFDVIVYGSDQIWRNQKISDISYNPVYFGVNGIIAKKHISFAASMGKISLSVNDELFIKSSLSNFSKITVREIDLKEKLKNIGIANVKLVCDPTFLLSADDWERYIPINRIVNEPYILLYQLQEAFDREIVEMYAKNHGLKLVVLSSSYDWRKSKDNNYYSPADFVSLIKYADLVLTSSFHGLAFSIIMSKSFYCSYKINGGRMDTLLELANLKGRYLTPFSIIPDIFEEIDWLDSQKRIERFVSDSKLELQL